MFGCVLGSGLFVRSQRYSAFRARVLRRLLSEDHGHDSSPPPAKMSDVPASVHSGTFGTFAVRFDILVVTVGCICLGADETVVVVTSGRSDPSPLRSFHHLFEDLVLALCEMTRDRVLLSVFFIYGLNMLIGPVLVGEFLTGSVGVAFSWGVHIDGATMTNKDTYMTLLMRFVLVYGPLLLFAAWLACDAHEQQLRAARAPTAAGRCVHRWPGRLFAAALLLLLVHSSFTGVLDLYYAYGKWVWLSPIGGLQWLFEATVLWRAWHWRRKQQLRTVIV